ncbi:MAG: hypothetical protein JWQ16_1273 [Novosphingobium sp.]|nr:hypothetical protein [Novosphingobium sp.]
MKRMNQALRESLLRFTFGAVPYGDTIKARPIPFRQDRPESDPQLNVFVSLQGSMLVQEIGVAEWLMGSP